ncbi:hypothetical protein V6Z12_D11G018300 [Gossypium hirsutum]
MSDEEMGNIDETSYVRPPKSISRGKTTFTLDNIPTSKWPGRLQKFHSWLDTRKLTEESHYSILLEFVSKFTGMLRDLWNSISQVDQIQFLVLTDLSQAIRIIHNHFIGNLEDLLTLKRRKFFKRKCYSYNKKDLSRHFHAMTKLFCSLGLEQSLKLAVLVSILEPLQVAINQSLHR